MVESRALGYFGEKANKTYDTGIKPTHSVLEANL